jgi:hypothetical protein
MEPIMAHCKASLLVNIALSRKFHELRNEGQITGDRSQAGGRKSGCSCSAVLLKAREIDSVSLGARHVGGFFQESSPNLA